MLVRNAFAGPYPGVEVFTAGEEGYFCIKIPELLTTQLGSILAFGEARTGSCSDFTQTALVSKRSTDLGASWSALSVVYALESTVIGNGAPVQLTTGRILLPFCRNNTDVWLTYSDDDGATWAPPSAIANVVAPGWKWIGTGPPASIQLTTGRIITPSYHTTLFKSDGEMSHSHVMYSDDDGASWSLGGTLSSLHWSNECEAVDLGNGTILINARSFGEHRLQATSTDGGLTFGPVDELTNLPEPFEGCEMSTIRNPENGWLFLSGPVVSGLYRQRMQIWANKQDGAPAGWHQLSEVFAGPSGYSALTMMPNGSIGLLFEVANKTEIIMDPTAIVFTVAWSP